MEGALEFGSVIVGFTALAARYVPPHLRDSVLPLVALVLGVGIMVLQVFQSGAGLSVATLIPAVYHGIILGGTSTGLYAVGMEAAKKVGAPTKE